jgi:hypothetical protein
MYGNNLKFLTAITVQNYSAHTLKIAFFIIFIPVEF